MYAYLDESGSPAGDTDAFLVVAVVAADQAAARALELHVKRLRRKLGRKARKSTEVSGGELKASEATPRQREKLLTAISAEEIAIVAVVVDKRDVCRAAVEVGDPEDLYRAAVGEAVRRCAERWHQLRLVLDKRYTSPALRERLEAAIRARLDVAADVSIEQADSRAVPCLQVTDYVAWAIRRKHETGERQCYALIESRIVAEVTLGTSPEASAEES